jgi:hypothetical protein
MVSPLESDQLAEEKETRKKGIDGREEGIERRKKKGREEGRVRVRRCVVTCWV